MAKKSFFKENVVKEIRDLNTKQIFTQRGLVNNILDLDPSKESLELRVRITPGKFFIRTENSVAASKKCYKHGDFIALSQPASQEEAYNCKEIPLKIRERDFNKLKNIREEEINNIGYSFRPVQGRDRTKRVVPFVWLLEGAKLYAYAENMTLGIEVEDYKDSRRVSKEGASIVCEVPSRTKRNSRYKFCLEHVPVDGNTEKRAVVWSIKPKILIEEDGTPITGRTAHEIYNIKYNYENDRQGSEVITFYPHDIAAYFKIIDKFYNEEKNLTPFEMSPFALPSKKEAEFYKKLCNNIVIYDPTLTGKEHFRKLHLDEKCILIARSIGVLGHDETMDCNSKRDGNLKDYNWE